MASDARIINLLGKGEEDSPLLNILMEDSSVIPYKPIFRRLTGSISSAILLNQILYWWGKNGRQPFYKFKQPCQHQLYVEEDSWAEELGFSRKEFDGALAKIGGRVKTGEARPDTLVRYHTTIDRVTYFAINEKKLIQGITNLRVKPKGGLRKSPQKPRVPKVFYVKPKRDFTKSPKGALDNNTETNYKDYSKTNSSALVVKSCECALVVPSPVLSKRRELQTLRAPLKAKPQEHNGSDVQEDQPVGAAASREVLVTSGRKIKQLAANDSVNDHIEIENSSARPRLSPKNDPQLAVSRAESQAMAPPASQEMDDTGDEVIGPLSGLSEANDDSAEARFLQMATNGKNPKHEEARVRGTLRHLIGDRFVKRFEKNLCRWTKFSNEQLDFLWRSAHPENWVDTPMDGKKRSFIMEDLLNEELLPRKPKTSMEEVKRRFPVGCYVEHKSWGVQRVREHSLWMGSAEIILSNGAVVQMGEVKRIKKPATEKLYNATA